eukprot:NODE_650_length_862_cov_1345.269373_g433_i0.p1 GENE.NODE_650_length_862_cov_1345.269373_g433_i0~~NODE_650_length_862_cov_1345.269373_g433_i0.p1  ORF type:complete len:172 (+),score=62.12 NODE_650_length_862_cov_1345.269373_g433_i0:29-544(+)
MGVKEGMEWSGLIGFETALAERLDKAYAKPPVFNLADTSPHKAVLDTKRVCMGRPPAIGETPAKAHSRFVDVFIQVTERYKLSNVMMVAHADGVAALIAHVVPGTVLYQADHACVAHFRRTVRLYHQEDPATGPPNSPPSLSTRAEAVHTCSEWELVTVNGANGIEWCSEM